MVPTINLSEIQPGDIFSEESHYTVTDIKESDIEFIHRESGRKVALSKQYVTKMLRTADQYDEEIVVTREDKRDGTLGIRSIFENISTHKVFTVRFTKQDKAKTKKAIAEEKAAQREQAVALIEKAKKQKKSMAVAYEEATTFLQENPIKDYIPGEERVLRGYKIDFISRDGKYNCVDMDIEVTEKENGIRPVNINTINELVVDGKRYIVK